MSMSAKIKKGKFVYKNQESLKKMLGFYDKTLAELGEPYRNISSKKDEYGLWINEVLNHYNVEKISFVVSSYSSAMFLSFAKYYPERVKSALLLVPSGIAHGSILPILGKMVVPFIKYYSSPSEKTLDAVIETMGGKGDETWLSFLI